ncbi:hypothetical protein [Parasediminibacterium sp. JCM 36343]|uniref:hypothetical protein n=1 Tax=Parasediminibacterium sp. JCM 36343 TaxID=3374279 RepID=UPI00397B752C
MKKLVASLFVSLIAISAIHAQSKTAPKDSVKIRKAITTAQPKPIAPAKDWSKVNLSNRPADHFMVQYGYDGWSGRPDSIRTKGFGRHFNFYVMFDKPFKTNLHYSVAYGAGIGSSNIFFDKEMVNLAGTGSTLPFTDGSNGDHFNKFKLTNIYLEIPAELRFYENPENTNSGWKAALGIKVGTLIKSYTKGKNWENAAGASYYGTGYIQKVSNKRFINGTKVAVSGRVGYGVFSLHGEYNILGVIKNGYGPTINSYSIGISIGGL